MGRYIVYGDGREIRRFSNQKRAVAYAMRILGQVYLAEVFDQINGDFVYQSE